MVATMTRNGAILAAIKTRGHGDKDGVHGDKDGEYGDKDEGI
jgi:hypothetical protein